jgi:hypothetical protein
MKNFIETKQQYKPRQLKLAETKLPTVLGQLKQIEHTTSASQNLKQEPSKSCKELYFK